MERITKLLILLFISMSCAGIDSYQYSGGGFDVGSNIYIEGGSGQSKITEDPEEDSLNLEFGDHSVAKTKTSIDLGMRIFNMMFSLEAGRILNDFEKSVEDITVEGDRRVVEEYKANTNYTRFSIMRRTFGGGKSRRGRGGRNSGGGTPGFFSLQVYYDFFLDSKFSELPNSEDKNIKGTGYGATFGLHMSGLYYNIGYNWREYENSLRMEDYYLSVGLAFQLF